MTTTSSTPADTKRAQRVYAYKRVCIPKPRVCEAGKPPGKQKYTTVSMHPQEFAKALRYAYGDERRVTDAIRHVAKGVLPEDVLPGDLSLIVRRKALARLRGQYRPAVAAEVEARTRAAATDAALAAENNQAWATA